MTIEKQFAGDGLEPCSSPTKPALADSLYECCTVCHRSESFEVVPLNGLYIGLRCGVCHVIRTVSSEAGGEEINTLNYPLAERLNLYARRRLEFRSRYIATWKFISSHTKQSVETILEIGSNTGAFVDFLGAHSDAAVTSIERNADLASHQRLRGLRCLESLDDLPTKEHFDAVILMDVLEHVSDCVGLLRELSNHLSSEGLVFLQFPNAASLAANRAGNRWPWWEAPDHAYHFSPETIPFLAASAGLQLQAIRTVSPFLDDLDAIFPLGPGSKVLHRFNQTAAVNRLITKGLKSRGSLLQVLFRKPLIEPVACVLS